MTMSHPRRRRWLRSGWQGNGRPGHYQGPSSYKIALLDETYRLKPEDLYQHAKVRET